MDAPRSAPSAAGTEPSGTAPPDPLGTLPETPAAAPPAQDFARRVVRVGTLAEPVRRRLYQYVVAQPEPVSRDEAAAAAGVPRHTAKFHLDRLVAEGLLVTSARRLTGRTGPGAGRPPKLYRRTSAEVAVSLPERHDDLAGRLMARAIDRSAADGTPVRRRPGRGRRGARSRPRPGRAAPRRRRPAHRGVRRPGRPRLRAAPHRRGGR